MLSSGNNKHLVVTQEQIQQVRDYYNVTRESLEENINTIIVWYETQPHLPQIEIDRDWIERIFLINKCSIEKTKERIDMLFTLRKTMPNYFLNRNPVEIFNANRTSVIQVILPKVAPDNSRIFCTRMEKDVENYNFVQSLHWILLLSEYTQHHDYSIGHRFISDFRNAKFGHVLKVNLSIAGNLEYIYRKVHGNRILGMHFISESYITKIFIGFLKLFLPSKIMGRITVHSKVEGLHEVIPKELLPMDYGGNEKSLEELNAVWEGIICSESYQKWLKQQESVTSDESKRLNK